MKQILFIISRLDCGGINRSLENLLSALPDEKLDISVLAFDTTGQYKDGFKGATMLKPNIWLNYLTRILSRQKGLHKIMSATIKVIDRLTKGRITKLAFKHERDKVAGANYDAVIAFSEGLPTHFLTPLNVRKKIAWIHCDFQSYLDFCIGKEQKEIDAYKGIDDIVCVSNFTKESFEKVAPQYVGKVKSIPNVLDASMMKRQSTEFSPSLCDSFNILTVGRIDPVKRPSVIPGILKSVLKRYPNVHWFLIGPIVMKSEYDKLIASIKDCGVERNIHLLGQKDNPYPYIKDADLLVNTSTSEACPYVVNEAKVLGTPVVCTDFGSARQFIKNGFDGYSVPVEEIAQTIIELISNKSAYREIKSNLSNFQYDNDSIVKQFLSLI